MNEETILERNEKGKIWHKQGDLYKRTELRDCTECIGQMQQSGDKAINLQQPTQKLEILHKLSGT